ncbi:MAG: DUF349 domain-containing protein [Actinomycetota bacterium]|nr:DUF349 domain-containing protein [Actinomycetota bacterium]
MASEHPDLRSWGRVETDGTVYVKTENGERVVGSWQAGDAQSGLAHFARRYDDLVTEVALLEQRLKSGATKPGQVIAKAREIGAGLDTAAVVGDLAGLRHRTEALAAAAAVVQAGEAQRRDAERAKAAAAKEALCVEAEKLADSKQWKVTGERFKAIAEEWKAIKGPDRKAGDLLWKRFAAARDAFGKSRGAHFAELDRQRETAREQKAELVREAEKLSTSTDWAPTANRMKGLMGQWKAAPRASREAEDELWTKFRAAQDAFFTARTEVFSKQDAEYVGNKVRKEELLAEAERMDPTADPQGAQTALRSLQDRYEKIGKVPRDAIQPLDERMRAVEAKVRDALDARWAGSAANENPMLASMRDKVADATEKLARAEKSGDAKRIRRADEDLAKWQGWLRDANS